MTDFYYNHSIFKEASESKVVNALEELRDIGQFLRIQGHRAFFSQLFWEVGTGVGKLHDLLQSSSELKKKHGDLIQLTLEYIHNGPFYPQAMIEELVGSKISIEDQVLYSCFYDQQPYLISSYHENNLVKKEYDYADLNQSSEILATLKLKVQAICPSDFKICNLLGESNLKTFLTSLTPFVSIENVFEQVEEEFPDKIVILHSARKSARGYKFESLDKVYKGLAGLVTEYLPGLKEVRTAQERFQQKVGIQCSGESECTKNLYGKERTFSLPTGNLELFEMHLKLGRKTRIYFFAQEGVIYIGHCGKHLSTCHG